MLYHISQISGLKTLRPHGSTHGAAYVYAIEDRTMGLLFGAKKDDFDFIMDVNEDGVPRISECYPRAFEAVYRGKCCSVYEVEETGFQRGLTPWEPELVCGHEVPVVRETVVEDLYHQLLEEERVGRLVICRYASDEAYRQMITAHVVDRIFRFDVDLHTCVQRDRRFAAHYQGIVQALLAVLDGHLLQSFEAGGTANGQRKNTEE